MAELVHKPHLVVHAIVLGVVSAGGANIKFIHHLITIIVSFHLERDSLNRVIKLLMRWSFWLFNIALIVSR